MEQKCLKTTAPCAIFYDILKHYKKTKFKELRYIPETMAPDAYQRKILEKDITLPKEPIYERQGPKTERLPRFFPNPEPNWGPKPRAKGQKREHAENEELRNENEADENEDLAKENEEIIKKLKEDEK